MIELDERVEDVQGYRTGDLAMVIYLDEENNLCKLQFDDYEFYGYDTSDVRSVYV